MWKHHLGSYLSNLDSGRQSNNPQRQVPVPRSCDYVILCGKKDFADVIKDLEMWRLIWITQVTNRIFLGLLSEKGIGGEMLDQGDGGYLF